MAGPEPYPQEKWTVEQEKAYAEGRASAAAGTGKGPASRSGKRKRYVKTAAGERRYGQPIGTEIGNPRNARAAEAQKDTESTGRYNELVGGDPKAQAAAMRGLDDGQVQRLAQVAYSFKSSDPNVVRLRIGVANELARRGFNVNDFGGLGGGSARAAGPLVSSKGKKRRVAPSSNSTAGVKSAMSAMYGRRKDRRLLEMSVPTLRAALGVFSRVAPDKREKVARFLVNQAVELSAANLLGQSVIEAANLPDERRTEVIELAGRWKHGWIPLDATAMRSKMKNGNGKPWWSGGKQGKRGSSSMRKTMDAKRRGSAPAVLKSGNNKAGADRRNTSTNSRTLGSSRVVDGKRVGPQFRAQVRPDRATDAQLRRAGLDAADSAPGGGRGKGPWEKATKAELQARGLKPFRPHATKAEDHPANHRRAPGFDPNKKSPHLTKEQRAQNAAAKKAAPKAPIVNGLLTPEQVDDFVTKNPIEANRLLGLLERSPSQGAKTKKRIKLLKMRIGRLDEKTYQQIEDHNAAAKASTGRDWLNKRGSDRPLGYTHHKQDGTSTFVSTEGSAKRTGVVKSGSKPNETRGAKVNQPVGKMTNEAKANQANRKTTQQALQEQIERDIAELEGRDKLTGGERSILERLKRMRDAKVDVVSAGSESKRDELNRLLAKGRNKTPSDYARIAKLRAELQDPALQTRSGHTRPMGKA